MAAFAGPEQVIDYLGRLHPLLETALLGGADCLITGDQDLLVMSPFHGIPIRTPAQAVPLH